MAQPTCWREREILTSDHYTDVVADSNDSGISRAVEPAKHSTEPVIGATERGFDFRNEGFDFVGTLIW
jgi:hypothetical protein